MLNEELNEEKEIEGEATLVADEGATDDGAGSDSVVRVYELGYILIPTLAEDEVPAVYNDLKELISSYGAEIISDEMPEMINLAYQMLKVTRNVRSKYTNGYFGWIKFEVDAQKVLELKNKLDLDPNFLRFLIMKTVRESTIAVKKPTYKDSPKRKPFTAKREDENAEPAEIDKEEIDKEIDALVEEEA